MMNLHRNPVLLLLFLCLPIFSQGQKKKTLFGLQYKPIINSDIGSSGAFTVNHEEFRLDVQPTLGNAWGMIIRTDVSESITLETGINRVLRKYDYFFLDTETSETRMVDFGVVNYEIPVRGLVFIQLGEKSFLNGALGFSMDMFASDVSSSADFFRQSTFRAQWIKFALEASLGTEYRTDKSGYFYLGATFHNSFGEALGSIIQYEKDGIARQFGFGLNTGYLTLDIRYFFHEEAEDVKKKKRK